MWSSPAKSRKIQARWPKKFDITETHAKGASKYIKLKVGRWVHIYSTGPLCTLMGRVTAVLRIRHHVYLCC